MSNHWPKVYMNRGIALLILFVFLIVLVFVPVKIPYTLVSIGNVLPAQEWRLIQDAGGGLSSSLQDNQRGVVERISSWQFERGDLFDMQLAIDPNSSQMVHKGDTIIRIYSSISNQQILDIENLIKVKSAISKELSTGEKPPVVQEAEKRLLSAKETYEQKSKELEIAKKLKEDGVTAELEFSRIKNEFEVAKIAIQIAEKSLQVANTGMKNETVQVNTTEIATLKKQLEFLKNRNIKYAITAPFDGVVSPIYEIGQVLVLHKVSECVVTIPVKVEEMVFLGKNPQILVNDPINTKKYNAKLLSKSPTTQIISMRSVGFLNCIITPYDNNQPITMGLGAKCEVHCDDLTPWQYLTRLMRFTISSN